MHMPCSAPPVPSVLMALALPLPSSSQTLDNGPCRALCLFILRTILPRIPPAKLSYPVSNFSSPDTDSTVVHGFVGLPT